jgi:hypothetical protein
MTYLSIVVFRLCNQFLPKIYIILSIIENVAHVKWALQPIFAQSIHNPFQNSPKHMLSLEHVFYNTRNWRYAPKGVFLVLFGPIGGR